MSYAGGGGGRTRMGTKVYLNIYDLSTANDLLYSVGLGLHHSGVEILGTEYSFASGAGIFESPPKVAPGARFREQIELGAFEGGQSELRMALSELRDDFGPEDYHLIRKNCNNFANSLVYKLLKKPVPSYVNRLADIGVCCSYFLPKKLLEHAPVGDPSDKDKYSNSGFTAYRPAGRNGGSSKPTQAAFQGSGNTLGSSSAERESLLGRWAGSSPSNKKNGQEDLTDRREKARKAALARLEQNQKQEN